MDDLLWGLGMTAAGMGTVFALLLLLSGALWIMGRLDRPAPVPAVEDGGDAGAAAPGPTVSFDRDGFDEDAIAAITIAVLTHQEIRRQQAAPAMRVHEPGSLLYASRWVANGRGSSNNTWRRN